MNLDAIEVKAFVPAVGFERAKAFYVALGFEVPWSEHDLAYVRYGETSFLLQAFDEPAFIANYHMHLLVRDVDAWHAHVIATNVVARFGANLGAAEDRPWGMRDFTLTDPSGVLWRIAQNLGGDA